MLTLHVTLCFIALLAGALVLTALCRGRRQPTWDAVLLLGTVAAGQDASSNGATSSQSTTTTSPAPAQKPAITQRKENQQQRIANGVKSGQLTPGETRRLERGEQRLQNNEKKDMAKDNGHLTKQDQRQLNREANHMSKRIYKDKHNAKTN